MTQEKIPHVSRELVERLEKAFPNRCPRITDTNREVWMAVGAAEVVKVLRRWYEQQEHNVLS